MPRTPEELLAATTQALRQVEWSQRSDIDYARVGMEYPAPYTALHCMACKGVKPNSGSITGRGHKFWCSFADLLVELGEEVEREEPTSIFLQLRASLVPDIEQARAEGQDDEQIIQMIVAEADEMLDIAGSHLSRQLTAKLCRDLGFPALAASDIKAKLVTV